jgi:hypothetical protein
MEAGHIKQSEEIDKKAAFQWAYFYVLIAFFSLLNNYDYEIEAILDSKLIGLSLAQEDQYVAQWVRPDSVIFYYEAGRLMRKEN